MEIVTEKTAGILRIEINRPQKKNAITAAMYGTMAEALAQAEREADVKVVLLHGSPAVFTAGNDLGDFMSFPASPPRGEAAEARGPRAGLPAWGATVASAGEGAPPYGISATSAQPEPPLENAPVLQFLRALTGASKPLVAAVTGPAVGVGTTLLLHCDLVYAGQSAQFRLPFVTLGLCPEAASSYLLPAIAGHQRAAEKLLLGEPFGAEEGQALGFVNQVLPDDQVLPHARAQAAKLAALSLPSLQTTKRLMKRAGRAQIEDQLQEEVVHFRRLLASPEAQQAFAAFFSRKKPGGEG
jgi:enoyl-CoA hydratase/carnithine racemase